MTDLCHTEMSFKGAKIIDQVSLKSIGINGDKSHLSSQEMGSS